MTNIDLGFQIQEGKAFLIRHTNKKEIPRDALLEIYQLILGHLAPNRDYSSVTSVRKLLRIIDLECEPDDSDSESEEAAKPSSKPAPKTATKPRRPVARTVRRTPVKPTKEEESDDDSDESDDE
uniref:Uncharacterized protein n=1 Tax=Marseillevirus LCMAC201 TaxID=2506605 RepID=A0A481YX80_9VIRU|nr:MAG: hypothetical protein LCMAC201_03970 [Marseillevirus LCMAC201]